MRILGLSGAMALTTCLLLPGGSLGLHAVGAGPASPASSSRESAPIAIVGGRVLTMGPEGNLEEGTVTVGGGKISRVGRRASIPPRARVIDARGKVVMPGMIDLHSHIGVYSLPSVDANADGNELTEPVTAQVRALDPFNPQDPAIPEAVKGGVTTVISRPGSGNVIGGQSVIVKLKRGALQEMVLREVGDVKIALEWNPILVYGAREKAPETRMEVYAIARKAFVDAQEYQRKWEEYEAKRREGEEAEPPERDLEKETLVRLLRREIPAHVHTSRADEVMSALRLAEEFGLDVHLGHAEWGYQVAPEIARRDVVAIVGPRMFRHDRFDLRPRNITGIMAAAGVRVAFQTDHPVLREEHLRYQAGLAVKYGMNEEEALKALTIHPAQAAHIDDRVGSLEEGKDADLVILDGDPLEVLTDVETVIIDGKIEYEAGGEHED